MSMSSGETVTLTCCLSSGFVSTNNYPSWYQQNLGQAPYALTYNTNSHFSGVPDHLSGSIALTIMIAQTEDEADYYCLLYVGSNSYTVS